LLLQSRSHAPLYGNRLANHLPMALLALDRLGSSGDYPRFVRFFQDRIREAGIDAVLHDWVPVLMPGLAASAFHGMIRLAYAIEGGLDDEIALALAYWASEYASLPLPLEPAEGSLEQIAGRLRTALSGHVFKPGIIIDKMLEIAWGPALAGAAVQPAAAPALRDIAGFALQAYTQREDFTLLHIVTGCHAFRIVQAYASDKALARRYLWQAALVAWLTVVVAPGKQQAPRADRALEEEDIAARALQSRDDHVIKLCHSALCEYREYGDAGYLQVATRKLQLDV
jgi:hypothetical protein